MTTKNLSAAQAISELTRLYDEATGALSQSLKAWFTSRTVPDESQRRSFCYPELRVTYEPRSVEPAIARSYAKFQAPGVYATTVTQPRLFASYLETQLSLLQRDYGATITVSRSDQPIPYPYVLKSANELGGDDASAAELAMHFPVPQLSAVGDEIADGQYILQPGQPYPLSLFDGPRVDYSLKRLQHYSGTPPSAFQQWILLTNYHRYVDQFQQWAVQQLSDDTPYTELVLPGGGVIKRGMSAEEAQAVIVACSWHKYQMPAYHLARKDGAGGITLVNIGVGPSNAKTMTDHLAVLRPHCWLMIGHCGGLRLSQKIGDYVLAHAYLREDHILDQILPPAVPVPALAEIQVALQQATAQVTGESGDALKDRLRTGTVLTHDDRNWELRWSHERTRINLSRAIAIDMESGTLAAQGYRFRVPYGTLLCVSDKPLHGEIKLPGAANAFYDRAVGEHLLIGIATLDILRGMRHSLHSRKLRSFDEPPFR